VYFVREKKRRLLLSHKYPFRLDSILTGDGTDSDCPQSNLPDEYCFFLLAREPARVPTPSLKADLAALDQLAHHRRKWSESDMRRYYRLLRRCGPKALQELDALRAWMLTPISIWPIHVQDIFGVALEALEHGKPLDSEMLFLIRSLPKVPSDDVLQEIIRHEHQVAQGNYSEHTTTEGKFRSVEQELIHNSVFQDEWHSIKARWPTMDFADTGGIIRRSFSAETYFRPGFSVDWNSPRNRFQAVFDCFCARWNLYGMKGDIPLVLKLSVNLTPHGTMIFIPAYWSFDAKRDVRWNTVTKLHRCRSRKKQGETLTENQIQRRQMAIQLEKLELLAKEKGLKGQKKHEFLCAGIQLDPRTSPKRLTNIRTK